MARGAEFIFRGVDQVSGEAGKVVDSLGKVNKRQKLVAREMAGLRRVMTATSAAFTAGSAALIKFTHAGDQIAKSARKVGVSAETYQSLGLAVRDAGGSTQGLYSGLRQLTRVVGETATGTGQGVQAFEQLGISVHDAGGNVKSTDDLLIEINKAMANVGSEAEKANIANRLFGRGWTDLNVVMREGGDAITNAHDRAKDLGVVVSSELLTKTEQATSQWEKLGTTFDAIGIKVAASFGGENGAIAQVQKFLSATSKMLDETSGRGLSAFGAVVEGLQYQILKGTDAIGITDGGAAAFEQQIIDASNMARAAAAAGGELKKLGETYQGVQEVMSTPLVDNETSTDDAPGDEVDLEDPNAWLREVTAGRGEILKAAVDNEADLIAEMNEQLRLAMERQKKEIEHRQKLNASIVSGFKNLIGVMGQQSKTALAISKAWRIAETIIAASQGVQAAFTYGMALGGPPLAASFASKAKIVGALNVAAVSAVQLGGGSQVSSYDGGGGNVRYEPVRQSVPVAPTQTTATPTGPTERTIYQINLPAETTPDPVAVTRLLDALQSASERAGGTLELQFGVQT